MPSTYSAGIGLEQPGNGEQAGVWGTTVNSNYSFLDAAIWGGTTITLSTTPYALDISDGLACSARNGYILFNGSPAADVTVTLGPNNYHRLFWAKNSTGKNIIFSQGSGATVTLPNGVACLVFADGAGAGAAVTGIGISPMHLVESFAVSGSAPTMDGTAQHWADSGGARYDGLSHKFDAYVASARKRVLELSSSGEALFSTDKLQINGTPASPSILSMKKDGSASPTNIEWRLFHDANGKDLAIRSYNGSATQVWAGLAHDAGTITIGKYTVVDNGTGASATQFEVAGKIAFGGLSSYVPIAMLEPSDGFGGGYLIHDGAAWDCRAPLPSDLQQEAAVHGDVLTWNSLVSHWVPAAPSLPGGGTGITKSPTIPVAAGAAGDIVLNSLVVAGGHAGWICLGGTTWKKFGIVDL